jgi:hypothetical protein
MIQIVDSQIREFMSFLSIKTHEKYYLYVVLQLRIKYIFTKFLLSMLLKSSVSKIVFWFL